MACLSLSERKDEEYRYDMKRKSPQRLVMNDDR